MEPARVRVGRASCTRPKTGLDPIRRAGLRQGRKGLLELNSLGAGRNSGLWEESEERPLQEHPAMRRPDVAAPPSPSTSLLLLLKKNKNLLIWLHWSWLGIGSFSCVWTLVA